MIEILALLFGVVLLAATAWCPPPATRLIGAVLVALVLSLLIRFSIGLPLSLFVAALAGALSYRYLPLMVLRRVLFPGSQIDYPSAMERARDLNRRVRALAGSALLRANPPTDLSGHMAPFLCQR